MSLVDLIGGAEARGLAASGLACLDRCVPLLGGGDEVLRPLWACLAEDEGGAEEWAVRAAKVRGELPGADEASPSGADAAALAARGMLEGMPETWDEQALRAWAEACSLAALRVHALLDPSAPKEGPDPVPGYREGRTEGAAPLVAAELRRQTAVLELLADHGPAGLRPALEICTEGRRVLRAVVSRRARGRR